MYDECLLYLSDPMYFTYDSEAKTPWSHSQYLLLVPHMPQSLKDLWHAGVYDHAHAVLMHLNKHYLCEQYLVGNTCTVKTFVI
jgi:hypothetical protein